MSRKPVNIDANYVSVATQLTCSGSFRCTGTVSCANTSRIILGTQSIIPQPTAIIICADGRTQMSVGKDGVRFECGFALLASPSIVIQNVSNDPTMSTASDSQIATSDAIRAYIDSKVLGATFDTMYIRKIQGPAEGVTIEGRASIGGNVAITGPLYYSCASVTSSRQGTPFTATTAIVFVSTHDVDCYVDISGPELNQTIAGTNARQIVRFINETPGVPCVLRFDCGSALLDGNLKLAHDTYLDNFHTRWVSIGIHDMFYPTRAKPICPGLCANSIDINTHGTLAMVGNRRDAGERGCAYLLQRYGSSWSSASEKIVGSRTLATMHQGVACAISGDSRVLASANEGEFWLFACISRQSGGDLPFRTQEFAHMISAINPIRAMALNVNGSVLVVASDESIALYDIAAPSCTLRTVNHDFCAPIYLTICGTTIIAKSANDDKILRASLSNLVHTVVADFTGAPICCDCSGTICLSKHSGSVHLRSLCSISDDKMSAIITHNERECARIPMESAISSYAMSRDGAFVLLYLENGAMKCLY